MTTKEQELKALNQIRKIMDALGENSYIAAAFEGCFEIAEENIKNDFACSMKQRAESAERKASKLELDNKDLRLAIQRAKESASKTRSDLEQKLLEANSRVTLSDDDLCDIRALVSNAVCEAEDDAKKAASQIVLFAEAPELPDFKQAVAEHRDATRRRDYLFGIQSRVEKIMYNK